MPKEDVVSTYEVQYLLYLEGSYFYSFTLWLHGVTPPLNLGRSPSPPTPLPTIIISFAFRPAHPHNIHSVSYTFPKKLIIIHSGVVLGHIDVVKQWDETPFMGKLPKVRQQMDYVEAT